MIIRLGCISRIDNLNQWRIGFRLAGKFSRNRKWKSVIVNKDDIQVIFDFEKNDYYGGRVLRYVPLKAFLTELINPLRWSEASYIRLPKLDLGFYDVKYL